MMNKILICVITHNLEPLKKFLLDRIYQENQDIGYLIIHLDEEISNKIEASNIFYIKASDSILNAKKEAVNFAKENDFGKICFIPVNYIPSKNFLQNLVHTYSNLYFAGLVGILNQTKNYYTTNLFDSDFNLFSVNQETERNLVEGLYIIDTLLLEKALVTIDSNIDAYLDYYISKYLQTIGALNCYISFDFAIALKANNKIVPKKTKEQNNNYIQLLNKIKKLKEEDEYD